MKRLSEELGGNLEIFVTDAVEGATGTNISNFSGPDFDPDWSPILPDEEDDDETSTSSSIVMLFSLPLIGYSIIEGLRRRRRSN